MKDHTAAPLLIRRAKLCSLLDVSSNGLQQLQNRYPDFPRGIKFGDTRQAAVFFDAAEVRQWIESRKADRGTTVATSC